jgi:general secretion pathway protein D
LAILVRARLLAALLLCLLLTPLTLRDSASAQGARAAATLAVVTLIAEAEDQSIFALTIGPSMPSYASDNTDPARPTLVVKSTARSPNLASEPTFRGLVRSIKYETTETGLAIRFISAVPAKLEAKQSAPDRLLVTVTKLTGAEAIGSRPVDSGGESVVPATDLPPAVLPPPGEDGYELVMLKYADVSEVVGLLTDGVTVSPNNVFIRREPGFGSVGNSQTTTYSTTQGQAAQEEKPLGQAVGSGLAIDRRLNAIWIKGSFEYIEWIKAQIAKIDIPVDSVILETQFVELTEAGARNVGIDFNNPNGQIAIGTISTGSFNPFDADLNDIIPSGQIQAAIYAQVAKGEGRILSKPRIAAQSGSTAKIITGDALPILTAITLSGVNAVQQQVQYVNVGVTLQIAPRVSTDGYVTSHIYGVVSSVTGYSQGYPTISQREAETSASVRDGETFVIGGLTMENNIRTRSKVPLLGDIPLIGEAFKLEKSTRSTTELYIVITPHIVRHRRFQALDTQTEAVGK